MQINKMRRKNAILNSEQRVSGSNYHKKLSRVNYWIEHFKSAMVNAAERITYYEKQTNLYCKKTRRT